MKKILVANRGEIAIRIMRSAREMGIATVAVFSAADRLALHVQYADEAIYIGEAASNLSYLNIENIISACQATQADAVHPGYGFLSENPAFAKALQEAGITLIGPSPEAMEIMGNKLSAKDAALRYNIPMIKGTKEPIRDIEEAKIQAEEIGFPILIKAAAGGGGKGMRIVKSKEDFKEELKSAISEAKSAFGDDSVFLERYITSPKHIEIQVLADEHGNVIHLFERECSIQRRHQKVVEEAPTPTLNAKIREEMGACAINVARSCNYVGAGTVEFIMDADLNFYFLEMNTRLQVEHPITEMITGVDLVKEQIKIARGEVLALKQEDLSIHGHAIELRIYAEDPSNNFFPDSGILKTYKLPEGPGVRVDNAYQAGMEISVYYDPMIAKLIVWADTRDEAIQRMKRAIDEYQITGIESTLAFGKFVMNHPVFQDGSYTTNFVDSHFNTQTTLPVNSEEDEVAAIIANHIFSKELQESLTVTKTVSSNWKRNRVN
ncbi:acetyl-CoA carboxylase biotin carboxylase subunit [Albibacterium sp.]|uniref:acetyl-CoA carboxylase biotin carboxylase subunit n=1 Tax=Albibacterium sp. TaxID=2952885 RepID=UPI002BCF194A|nr:acetyl-CoA carboxylase biotin carboxylase subunit [Albibacterium sp.]HUH18160.1 acetyl-CoA carboxylase biotin carboxylase subunit [Albibacterium sp.]